MDIERVLNDYRNGDVDKRLSLFLYNRDLRTEFSRIDDDTAVEQAAANTSSGVKALYKFIGFKCRCISARFGGTVLQ